MKKIAAALILLTTILNCGEKADHSIDGKINTLGLQPNQQMYLYKVENQGLTPIDSAVIGKEGEFSIAVEEPKNGIFHVGTSLRNTFPLVLNDETKAVEVQINNNQQISMDYTVKGSEASKEIAQFAKEVFSMMQMNQNFTQKAQQLNPNDFAAQQKLQQEYGEASKKFVEYRNSFIERNKNSEALIAVIDQIDPASEYELLQEVASGINTAIPNSAYAKKVNDFIKKIEDDKVKAAEREKLLAIGQMAPELEFPNTKGELIKLSDMRGKVVLIDFWASWCKPCRAENPNVVATYKKYKNKGFDVFSFSLDRDKESWINAIAQDGLEWENHASDLKFWETEAVNIYGFQGIPFTVLIDREGKILAKGLRGPALEQKLIEVL